MMVEAAQRGHEVHCARRKRLMWKGGRVIGEHCRLHLLNAEQYLGNPALHDEDWYRARRPRASAARRVRRGADAQGPAVRPGVRDQHLAAVELAVREGARVFNDPRAIRDHNEKLAIARVPAVHRARRW